MLYNKKGELTTKQIVIFTILIVSFGIILFLMFRLNLGESAKKELCRDSVFRNSAGILGDIGESPLNCKRSYVCISKNGECDKLPDPDEIIKVKTKEEIYSALADEMADCWWMFGEGELNYVSKELTSTLHCSICSQVWFDESVGDFFENADDFNQRNLYEYLTNEIPNKEITYSEYLFGFKANSADDFLPEGAQFDVFSLDKPYLVMMGVFSEISTLGWVAVGGGIAAITVGAVVFSPLVGGAIGITTVGAMVIGGSTVGGGAVAAIFSGVISNDGDKNFIYPTIIEKASVPFEAIKCEKVVTRP